eukprot:15480338-Alexandrium_andersonii.AAC.1
MPTGDCRSECVNSRSSFCEFPKAEVVLLRILFAGRSSNCTLPSAMEVLTGFSHAKSKELRGLRIGGLRIEFRDFAASDPLDHP